MFRRFLLWLARPIPPHTQCMECGGNGRVLRWTDGWPPEAFAVSCPACGGTGTRKADAGGT
jgi:DnaJ-class molecular chaperone